MRFEMHVHTADSNDPVANIPASEIVKLYHEKGYDGIVITDHFSAEVRDWLEHETRGMTHAQYVDRWLKGYRSAKEMGDRIGCTVFLGMELRFADTINDYLVYGIDEYFLKNNPPLDSLNLDELNRIKTDDILVYQAHPFRERMVVGSPEKLFGVEIHNGATSPQRNYIANVWADTFQLHKISGSDFHRIHQLAQGGLDFQEEIHSYSDFIHALKNDRYTLITDNSL